MIEALREKTNWSSDTPNHTYLVLGDKLIGYIKQGCTEGEMFKIPKQFDRRYRKFEKVSIAPYPQPEQLQEPDVHYVKGSSGETYKVNTAQGTCSCPSFKFRRTCKHLKE
jgi:hypothetical protein